MKNRGAGDFAVVGIHQDNVFLEANEWDSGDGTHYVVTLYLEPAEALQLAEKLNLCAIGVQREFADKS
jgi:hypothetical protein